MPGRTLRLLLMSLACTAPGLAAAADDGGKQLPPETLENLRRFVQIVDKVKAEYVRPVDDKELVDKALAGMLPALDPQSAYLSPADFAEMNVVSTGKFGSVGLELQTIGGYSRVVSPIDGTPAARAGVATGELIVRIDGKVVIGLPIQDVVRRLRGDPGTTVTLALLEPKTGRERELSLVREIIKAPGPSLRKATDNVLMLRIAQFRTDTVQDVKRQLREQAGSAGGLKGLILDLRNNPGGVFSGCIDVANLFLPGGTVIAQMRGRAELNNRLFTADARNTDPDWSAVPMVVLVNSGSAACSELLAAALRDNGRATLIGAQTYGRATVQTIVPLADGGAIKLTTAEWVTPKGVSINGVGVMPDVDTGEADPLPPALARLGAPAATP
jgi:carboxyl-terminal processing protease